MEKNMFFIIPEMPSKAFVMVKKKLPDHFNLKSGSGRSRVFWSNQVLYIFLKIGSRSEHTDPEVITK